MLAFARTYTLLGIYAREVSVEVDVNSGLPIFMVVGLPDAAVREARERVRGAIINCGFDFPQQRITTSLAPADLRKAGPSFDLAIAAALLAASKQLDPALLERYALAGELSLDGSVRPVPGALAMAEQARRCGVEAIVVPVANAAEAALAGGIEVVPLDRLGRLRDLASGAWRPEPPAAVSAGGLAPNGLPDIADLRGQPSLRRALEIAAAGGHGVLMIGPPGAGKSLAAKRLPSIMPPLDAEEALEVIRVASACGRRTPADGRVARPFRAPHHTISSAGLVGGGNPPRPGEITLAHRGLLFLDELGEFPRDALEALRQPLEDGQVRIVRARHAVELPCRFTLIAAANPCPCGRGEDDDRCRCTPQAVRRYGARLSGALADRIDICLAVEQPPSGTLSGPAGEDSTTVRARVVGARERQVARLGAGRCNADVGVAELRNLATIGDQAQALLEGGMRRLGLSGRGHDRVLRVARTIADLSGAGQIAPEHVEEALALRRRNPEPG